MSVLNRYLAVHPTSPSGEHAVVAHSATPSIPGKDFVRLLKEGSALRLRYRAPINEPKTTTRYDSLEVDDLLLQEFLYLIHTYR